MTILITGATGRVGSRLVRRLVAGGVECRVLVRPGRPVPEGVHASEGDLLDPASLDGAVRNVSAVVHLGAALGTNPPEVIDRVNHEGTRHLIAALQRQAPAARLVLASTGLVYRSDLAHPAREDDPIGPTAPYPASKVAAERAVRSSGLDWSILRLGYVYGDGDGRLQSAPAQFAGVGWHPAKTISLLHQSDVATAVDLALAGVLDGLAVNVVDDAPATIYEIATLVGASYPQSAEPVSQPWIAHMDGSLIRRLGFRASVATMYQAARDGVL